MYFFLLILYLWSFLLHGIRVDWLHLSNSLSYICFLFISIFWFVFYSIIRSNQLSNFRSSFSTNNIFIFLFCFWQIPLTVPLKVRLGLHLLHKKKRLTFLYDHWITQLITSSWCMWMKKSLECFEAGTRCGLVVDVMKEVPSLFSTKDTA